MNDARGKEKEQGPKGSDPLAAIVRRGANTDDLDISKLTEAEQNTLVLDYQRGLIDIRLRAASLGVDVTVLGETLRNLAEQTQEISTTEGASVTITHTQDSSLGRTEIIMGNTDQAHRGRLTKSQSGEKDWTPYYVIGGLIVAAIVVIAIFAG